MTPIALFPSDSNRKKGLIGSGMLFFLAYQAMTWSGSETTPMLVWVFGGLGIASLAPVARSFLQPRPSFAADAQGFSVMGKPKRPWDEFRGVHVRTASYFLVPISRSVVVKTGKNVLGGSVQISPAFQSASAKEMAAEIAQYARRVQLGAVVMPEVAGMPVGANSNAGMPAQAAARQFDQTFADFIGSPDVSAASAQPAQPSAPRPAPMPTTSPSPAASFEDRLSGEGPISSTPRLSERLFGRRKVL